MLSFAVNNPEEMSDVKEFIDASLTSLVESMQEFANNKGDNNGV